MGLFSLFLASCPLIEGRQREWNGREALASLEWNFSAAEGPPAHNPQINSFQLSPSANKPSNEAEGASFDWFCCWLAAELLAPWVGLHSSIQFNSLSLSSFLQQRKDEERAAQVELIDSFHFNCCFLFISLVDRLCLSSLWASCLGAGPPAITNPKTSHQQPKRKDEPTLCELRKKTNSPFLVRSALQSHPNSNWFNEFHQFSWPALKGPHVQAYCYNII